MADAPTFGPESVPRRNLNARMRKFRGKLIVASGPHAVELDEIGAFVLQRVDGSSTVLAIARQLAGEYDVSVEVAAEDIGDLLGQLAETDMVDVVTS